MSHFKPNTLSLLGRMGYSTHLLFYPSALAFYVYVFKPYWDNKNKVAEQKEWDTIPKARKVDPDLFSPFSPIPYHNNPELKYIFTNINMHGYLNKNHINPEDYAWKDFHNSYDHNHRNAYQYNWVSMTGPKE